MQALKTMGIDLAKTNFHLSGLDACGKKIINKKMKREHVLSELASHQSAGTVVAMEACASAHYWAQQIQQMGFTVKLYNPKVVKAYASTKQKNDANDALSIAKTALDPDRRTVAIKTRAEQQISFIHKRRKQLIEQRIQNTNELRAVLCEFGIYETLSCHNFINTIGLIIEEAHKENPFFDEVYLILQNMVATIQALQADIKTLDKVIVEQNKSSETAKQLLTIPGVGPICASILRICPMSSYDNPRDFSASLGLVPSQNTTGGTIKLGRITKHGSRYIRSVLIQGSRSLIISASRRQQEGKSLCSLKKWALQKVEELGFNKASVAVANKLARISWAVIIHGKAYDAR